MTNRLERIVMRLAKKHAPHLLPPPPAESDAKRVAALARKLANHNVLVMMGYLPAPLLPAREAHVQRWVDLYGQLYDLLARSLFPSFTEVTAQYADVKLPVVVVIQGASTPVISVLAGFVTPYIATRQSHPTVSEAELLGLMGIVLDELEARDLRRARYDALRAEGVEVIRSLLACPVRQVGVTAFDRPVFGRANPLSAPPDKLPEQGRARQPKASKSAREAVSPPEKISIPVLPHTSRRTLKRRPPVPDLPDDEGEKGR